MQMSLRQDKESSTSQDPEHGESDDHEGEHQQEDIGSDDDDIESASVKVTFAVKPWHPLPDPVLRLLFNRIDDDAYLHAATQVTLSIEMVLRFV